MAVMSGKENCFELQSWWPQVRSEKTSSAWRGFGRLRQILGPEGLRGPQQQRIFTQGYLAADEFVEDAVQEING